VPVDSITGGAPSFRTPVMPGGTPLRPATPPRPAPPKDARPEPFLPGARVDDFEVVKLLGRGAFGNVYLARQLSLDRLVALKISANRGSEGRTMARLEHRHIVQVFSETVDRPSNQRLLCMQLVPGIGFEKLIPKLHERPDGDKADAKWSGRDVLAIISASSAVPPVLDTAALKDRESLERMNDLEAVAWFGARLAEALDFAHGNKVLHRDIKPANILVDSYGRPMLADFNISSHRTEDQTEQMFGGTFAYMSPEHLDAFNPDDDTKTDAVNSQSDIYALGLVMHQMLEGKLAFPLPDRARPMGEMLRSMAAQRREKRPVCREGRPDTRKVLERTIGRCLAPEPADRFATGDELAEQLDGCRRLRGIEARLPAMPRFLKSALNRPFLWLILLFLVPQIVASVVNFGFNFSQIVRKEVSPHRELFKTIAIIYNLVAYAGTITLFVITLRPVIRCWRALTGCMPISDEEVAVARQKALRLPIWFVGITAVGWYTGGEVLPVIVKIFSPENPIAHFMLAHLVSGLIAMAYSMCGTMFIVLRVLYPAMWLDTREITQTARRELANVPFWLTVTQYLAFAVPVMTAVFLMIKGDTTDKAFLWLAIALIVLGCLGFVTASTLVRRLSQIVELMTKRVMRAPETEDLATSY
jgi:serine/threonine protein kinase